MERLNDIMGRAMQRRPASSGPVTPSSRPASPTSPAQYGYSEQQRGQQEPGRAFQSSSSDQPGAQRPQQNIARPTRSLPEQTGRAGYAGRGGYTSSQGNVRPTGRAESSERLGGVPASQPSSHASPPPARIPGEHPAIRPSGPSSASGMSSGRSGHNGGNGYGGYPSQPAQPSHPYYTRPLSQARTSGNTANPESNSKGYQPTRTPSVESYHPLKTRPIAVQRPAEDYTVSPRARADALDTWEDDERATTIQYGDWEDDEQEIVVYQRATPSYYESEHTTVERQDETYASYTPYTSSHTQSYPQHPLVTRNLREVQVQEVTPELQPASEPHHRHTQPLDPRIARHVGSIERDESKYSDEYTSYRSANNISQVSPPAQQRPVRPLRQPTPQSREVATYNNAAVPAPVSGTNTAISPAPVAQTARHVCPKCRGAGYLRADVPFGHPNFGKPIACECKEMERKEKRRQQLRDMSNMDAFRDSNFRTFNPRVPGVQEAYRVAREFSQDPDGWLLLVGPNGCGKTHLAASIANQSLDSGSVVLFAVVPDLLDHLRAAFAPTAKEVYDQLFSKMREAELLVLDDLGSQQSSPWANEKLFQLLNYRYNMGMPTVITANPKGLQGVDERIRSRLTDISLVTMVVMDRARDYRPNHPRRDV